MSAFPPACNAAHAHHIASRVRTQQRQGAEGAEGAAAQQGATPPSTRSPPPAGGGWAQRLCKQQAAELQDIGGRLLGLNIEKNEKMPAGELPMEASSSPLLLLRTRPHHDGTCGVNFSQTLAAGAVPSSTSCPQSITSSGATVNKLLAGGLRCLWPNAVAK